MASKNKQNREICPVKEGFQVQFDGEKEERPWGKCSVSIAGAVTRSIAALGRGVWDSSGRRHWEQNQSCFDRRFRSE